MTDIMPVELLSISHCCNYAVINVAWFDDAGDNWSIWSNGDSVSCLLSVVIWFMTPMNDDDWSMWNDDNRRATYMVDD